MKFMVVASLVLASLSAQAINLKSCVVKTTQKGTSFTQTQKVVIANGRANFVRASESTILTLILPSVGANADVYVNEQRNFIFKGDVSQGSFESAMDQGTIECSAGTELPFIYQGQFVPRTMGPGDIGALGGCYAGDAKAAGIDLAKITKANPSDIRIDRTTGAITVPTVERQCVQGRGTNPDDYVCDKYGNVKVTYKMKNCDYDPDARP